MKGRQGGGKTTERKVNNDVEFHPVNAYEMMNYLFPHVEDIAGSNRKIRILDACSGTGNLGNATVKVVKETIEEMEKLFEDVNMDKTEIELEQVDIKHGRDVLELEGKYDIIVCNPPWDLKTSLPIYWHIVNNLMDKSRSTLFFIINNVFCYQGSERAESLQYQKYYFLPRWTFKHTGRPLLDCGVMVCERGKQFNDNQIRPYIPLTRQYK